MSVPAIDVILYPRGPSTTQHQLQYLELAPANAAAMPVCPLPLQISILNKQGTSLHLTQIDVVFANPALNKSISVNLEIFAGSSNTWYASNDQYLFLPSPPPSPFTIALHFTGFDPWSAAVHFIPFPNSYLFPGRHADLGVDEFWVGKGAAHAGGGDQIFHYDLGMMGWDPGKSQWRDMWPGKDGTKNEDYRIWNRPVYALADGVVTFYENSVNENPKPWVVSDEGKAKGYGNAFLIQHGDYFGTYMHMRKGTLNPALTIGPEGVPFWNGPAVQAGQFLGLAGNAGTSSNPHLHVGLVVRDPEMRQFSVPLAFSRVGVVQDSLLDHADPHVSPWVDAVNQGLPWVADGAIRDAVAPANLLPDRLFDEKAIDLLALLLRGETYIRWKLPDPPPIDVITAQIRAQVAGMTPSQRRRALARAKNLQQYGLAMERELNKER